MKKFINISLIVFLFILVVLSVGYKKPKTFEVILTKNGFEPALLTIKEGDSLKFSTNLDTPFWPASDPHPNHSAYSTFDPKKAIKSGDSWTFEFSKAGRWNYHDHLTPNARGIITVKETSLADRITSPLVKYYRLKYEKRDFAFLKKQKEICEKFSERGDFLNCWYVFFSGVSSDFGVRETIRLISESSKAGLFTYSDCHLFADATGTEGYWEYSNGSKFGFDENFSICDNGFFHGFMSEFMSHGQDFRLSQELCDNLPSGGTDMVRQCYVGMGNGLSFYHWSKYGREPVMITRQSIEKCEELSSHIRDCVFGVYSGIDHLFLGLHGSDMAIDLNDPFFLCNLETIGEYKIMCYERMIPSLFWSLRYNPNAISPYLAQIKGSDAIRESVRRVGIMLSEQEIYKFSPDINMPISGCRKLPQKMHEECIWGVFYNVYLNLKEPGSHIGKMDCNKVEFQEEKISGICNLAKSSALE